MKKQIIMPGYLKIQVVEEEDRQIGGIVKIYTDTESIHAPVIDHCKWQGDEFLSPSQKFLFGFFFTRWMFKVGIFKVPIKLKHYPKVGDTLLLPGVTGQSYYQDGKEYKFVHISDVREWDPS